MLSRRNKILSRFKLVVIAPSVVAACLLGLLPVATSFYNLAGLPIQIAAAAAGFDKGVTTLSYALSNAGGAEVSAVDMVLFDFNPAGKLLNAQAWNLQPGLGAGKSATFSLRLRSHPTPASRLVLSVEAVRADADVSRNTATNWQADFTGLAQAVATLVAGGNAVSPQTTQARASIPELFGSSYCSDAFGRAFRLSKAGGAQPLTAFTCDRNERSFVFGFNGKSLAQK